MFIEFFLENFSWRFILWNFDSRDFSIKVFKILNEDFFIGDFSYEDLFIGGFSLKNWGLFFLKSYLEDLSFEHLKIFKEDLFMEIFPLKYGDFSLKIHPGDFSITILKNFIEDLFIRDFSLKNSFEDFSFDDLNIFNEDLWRFFLLKICSLRFFLEDLLWRFFHWIFKIFKKICSWRFFFWNMVLEIFLLKNGDFSFRRFVRGDFSLKIYFGDFSIEFLKIFKKICSWRFFLWNMVLEIFPFEDLFMKIFPWRFILRDFSIEVLEIFIEDLFIGDFSFWRFVHGDFSLKIYS